MVGVEQWAEVRRMHRVEGLSGREISRRAGLARDTVARLLGAPAPPKYERRPAGSKLDPFKEWICGQLAADPRIQSQRLREMACELGYEGGRSIFDEFVRETRPRFLRPRTFQRTVYRPGELVQCDLWEPRELIAVGHGQHRRGWVVTCEVCWSRAIAGTLIFQQGGAGHPLGSGPESDAAGGVGGEAGVGSRVRDRDGRPPDLRVRRVLRALEVGWVILEARDPQAKGLVS